MKTQAILVVPAVAVALLAPGARSAAQGGTRIQINGRSSQADVRMIGGKPYVSLSDMARALGLTVVKKPGGYQLIAAGGANEVAARARGKIGDELFTGDWRFQVTGMTVTDRYMPRFSGDTRPISPDRDGDTLVILACRVKNGHRMKELINFQNMYGEGDHTALADDQAHSYPLTRYDVHYDYFNYGAYALPGAAIDFALIFEVPRGTNPRELIYSIYRYDDRGEPKKHTDVRVTLKR